MLPRLLRVSRIAAVVLALLGVGACSSDDVNNELPADDAPDGQSIGSSPGAPEELKGVVYTESQCEIFWTAATDTDGTVVGYDIYRNDQQLVSALDAQSYYDDTIEPASDYRYTVIAVDDHGNPGTPAEITLSTPELAPTINQANLIDVIDYVLSVFVGDVYNSTIVSNEEFSGLDPVSATSPDPANTSVQMLGYDCPDGGNATVTSWISCSGACESRESRYDACVLDKRTWDGSRDYHLEAYGRNHWDYRDYVITNADGRRITVEGEVDRNYSTCKSDNYSTWHASLSRYEAGRFEGTTILTDVDTSFGYGKECQNAERAELSGSFIVQSVETGNKQLTVTVTNPFANTDNQGRRFPVGRMQISADDGTALTLDADNGDPATATVTLHSGDTVLQTGNESWDLWVDRLTFDTSTGPQP